MYSLFLLSTLITLCTSDPRTPRIYNVLISTKKNLAPSQALPVYEPVLRTTSLGLAFPPLIYTPLSTIEGAQSKYVEEAPVIPDATKTASQPQPAIKEIQPPNDNIQELPKYETKSSGGVNLPNNVLPIEPYVPYYTPLTYEPYYPKDEQAVPAGGLEKNIENVNDPKQIVANLKKNPDIPDVPPPPLPVKT
ncbi:hypothetical protein NQ318_013538 [Aromia moschata]|uniref:Uncharacterized protein n=1 Tax=Aromia moschata TaxID=1265417 RepID=A0AAV8XZP1_9CUCU|nr:hypothetical protein NQ318_013538 [Aromia moschata]